MTYNGSEEKEVSDWGWSISSPLRCPTLCHALFGLLLPVSAVYWAPAIRVCCRGGDVVHLCCAPSLPIFFFLPLPPGETKMSLVITGCVSDVSRTPCVCIRLSTVFSTLLPFCLVLPACSGSLCCNGMALAPAVLSGALPRLCISVYLLVLPLVCLLVCPFLHVTLPPQHGRPHRSCPGARLRQDAVGDPRLRQVHTFFIISGNMLCRGHGGALTWSLLGLRFHAGAY